MRNIYQNKMDKWLQNGGLDVKTSPVNDNPLGYFDETFKTIHKQKFTVTRWVGLKK
jgi:hypothetical protein